MLKKLKLWREEGKEKKLPLGLEESFMKGKNAPSPNLLRPFPRSKLRAPWWPVMASDESWWNRAGEVSEQQTRTPARRATQTRASVSSEELGPVTSIVHCAGRPMAAPGTTGHFPAFPFTQQTCTHTLRAEVLEHWYCTADSTCNLRGEAEKQLGKSNWAESCCLQQSTVDTILVHSSKQSVLEISPQQAAIAGGQWQGNTRRSQFKSHSVPFTIFPFNPIPLHSMSRGTRTQRSCERRPGKQQQINKRAAHGGASLAHLGSLVVVVALLLGAVSKQNENGARNCQNSCQQNRPRISGVSAVARFSS
ncbi:hypothetical protein F5884DRAFT_280567 [Xylogone sp. PMI_703]|nr:hypothetical protein F5884DRAFT_280567 [Xylogone sp. PMI_703]